MYQSINLLVYAENNISFQQNVHALIVESRTPFKEVRSLGLLFSSIKNPPSRIILMVKTKEFLNTIETLAKTCHNYQSRIFIVHETHDTEDGFFANFCINPQLDKLKSFINNNSNQTSYVSHQSSNLLSKLIELELTNLDISKKYIGFKYLTDLIVNAFCSQFYSNNYIQLFEYVATSHLQSIDTIERDVRHMLLTTWERSEKFKSILQQYCPTSHKPNSKKLLKAIISHLKNTI